MFSARFSVAALLHVTLGARIPGPLHPAVQDRDAGSSAGSGGSLEGAAPGAASLAEASASARWGPAHAVAAALAAALAPGGVQLPPPQPPLPSGNVAIEQQAPAASSADFYGNQERERLSSEKMLLQQTEPPQAALSSQVGVQALGELDGEQPLRGQRPPPLSAKSANPAPAVVTLKGRPSGSGCGGGCGGNGVCFATWNIQKFGVPKERRPAVMEAIREVLGRYDVAVIEELSQKPKAPYECGPNTESVICAARPKAGDYKVAASPWIGDEQYAVMARDGAVVVSERGATYPDPNGVHFRPPHVFDVTVKKGPSDWRLALGVTHTSPKRATEEVSNFPDVLRWMQGTFDKTHYVLAGDYNADGKSFDEKTIFPDSRLGSEFQGFSLMTGNKLDSTVAKSSNSYDRVIVDEALAKNSGDVKVFRLENIDLRGVRKEGCQMGYVPEKLCTAELDGLAWSEYPRAAKTELAKELSDHYPVEMCLRDD